MYICIPGICSGTKGREERRRRKKEEIGQKKKWGR